MQLPVQTKWRLMPKTIGKRCNRHNDCVDFVTAYNKTLGRRIGGYAFGVWLLWRQYQIKDIGKRIGPRAILYNRCDLLC